MAQSPVDNGDTTFTSFSNPNYGLEDRLNSNYSSQQYNDSNVYEDLKSPLLIHDNVDNIPKNTSAKNQRKKYAALDLASMGMTSSPDSGSSSGTSTIHSPDEAETVLPGPNRNDSNEKKFLDFDGTYATVSDFCFPEGDVSSDTGASDVTPSSDTGSSKRGFLGYYSMLEAKARESTEMNSPDDIYEEVDHGETTPSSTVSSKPERFNDESINSPDSNDSGIQSDARSDDSGPAHIRAASSEDLYAVVNKPHKDLATQESITPSEDKTTDEAEKSEDLPAGWEKCQDEEGSYFWHIKSGTIQREPPEPSAISTNQKDTKRSISSNSDESTVSGESVSSVPSSPTSVKSATEEHLNEFEGHALQYAANSLKNMKSSGPNSSPASVDLLTDSPFEKAIRFAVRSLGWVGIDEADLTPERSSKAVNKCIVDLSLGRNDINDVVGRWGDGKDLYMDLDTTSLRLIDPQDVTPLNSQAIHSIRVWGVGRDNGRDFAYVARDKSTKKHMCHVFRCDTPARQIANTLRDICKKIMMERSLIEQGRSLQSRLTRPTDLPNLETNGQPNGQKLTFHNLYNNAQFPTPMEEPKKVIRCHYIGMHQVDKATGMDTLNSAVEDLYNLVPPEKWLFASVAVAPSTITITEHNNPDHKVDECRVRFLSFMGIAMKNVKLCAFIMHTAQDQFFAHVFHCEPSAGPLCKTIEAACKLRYQKCLDAHPQTPDHLKKQEGKLGSLGASLKAGMKAKVQSMVSVLKNSLQKPAGSGDDSDSSHEHNLS